MTRIRVIEARKDLADILNRAAYGKERVVLTRRGKDVAAIVPMDDLNVLEAIEDDIDIAESTEIMARIRAGTEQLIPLEDIEAKYREPAKKAAKARKGHRIATAEEFAKAKNQVFTKHRRLLKNLAKR